MQTKTYVYYFKSDSMREAIGFLTACTIVEAQEKICIIKQLPKQEIEHLFVIKPKKEHDANNF